MHIFVIQYKHLSVVCHLNVRKSLKSGVRKELTTPDLERKPVVETSSDLYTEDRSTLLLVLPALKCTINLLN